MHRISVIPTDNNLIQTPMHLLSAILCSYGSLYSVKRLQCITLLFVLPNEFIQFIGFIRSDFLKKPQMACIYDNKGNGRELIFVYSLEKSAVSSDAYNQLTVRIILLSDSEPVFLKFFD